MRAREAAYESLRSGDAYLAFVELEDRRGAIEHVQPSLFEHRGDLVSLIAVEIVVPENRTDGDLKATARVSEDLRLLRLAVRRQITGEEYEVCLLLDLGESLLDARAGGL